MVTTHFQQAVSSTRVLVHLGGVGRPGLFSVTEVSADAQVNPARQMHMEMHIWGAQPGSDMR